MQGFKSTQAIRPLLLPQGTDTHQYHVCEPLFLSHTWLTDGRVHYCSDWQGKHMGTKKVFRAPAPSAFLHPRIFPGGCNPGHHVESGTSKSLQQRILHACGCSPLGRRYVSNQRGSWLLQPPIGDLQEGSAALRPTPGCSPLLLLGTTVFQPFTHC